MKVIVISFTNSSYSNPTSVERICSSVDSFRKYFETVSKTYENELSLEFDFYRVIGEEFNESLDSICNRLQSHLDEDLLACAFGRFLTNDGDEFFRYFIQIRNIH